MAGRNTPAKRDQNNVAIRSGVSSTDGSTTVMFRVDPVTNYLLVDITASSNSATVRQFNKRDENHVPSMYGISSVDGRTLVPIRTDSIGRLLTTFN